MDVEQREIFSDSILGTTGWFYDGTCVFRRFEHGLILFFPSVGQKTWNQVRILPISGSGTVNGQILELGQPTTFEECLFETSGGLFIVHGGHEDSHPLLRGTTKIPTSNRDNSIREMVYLPNFIPNEAFADLNLKTGWQFNGTSIVKDVLLETGTNLFSKLSEVVNLDGIGTISTTWTSGNQKISGNFLLLIVDGNWKVRYDQDLFILGHPGTVFILRGDVSLDGLGTFYVLELEDDDLDGEAVLVYPPENIPHVNMFDSIRKIFGL
jgi:hypothetical protein